MARAAAAEAGIPGLWHRLRGDTREELRADAEELAYERDHPPDQATLDREAAENEARIAECKEQVAANKAEIAEIKARIDDLDDLPEELLQAEGPLTLTGTDEDGNVWTGPVERIDLARGFADRRRIDAQIAKLDARADALRAEIHRRLAERSGMDSGPRARESRPRPTRAGAGSQASRDGPSDEPPLDGRRLRLRPELIVRVPLEGTAVVELHAESFEDEWRLLRWLVASDAVLDLSVDVLHAVSDLLGEESAG